MNDAPQKSRKRGGRKKKVYPSNLKRANELRAKEAAAVHELAEQGPNLQQENLRGSQLRPRTKPRMPSFIRRHRHQS